MKPCKECPFSRSCEPGALGGSSWQTYVGQIVGPFLLNCHAAKDYDKLKDSLEGVQCAGAAIFRANVCVSYFLPDALLKSEPDSDLVFEYFSEFVAHHEQISVDEAESMLEKSGPMDCLNAELVRSGVRLIGVDTDAKFV